MGSAVPLWEKSVDRPAARFSYRSVRSGEAHMCAEKGQHTARAVWEKPGGEVERVKKSLCTLARAELRFSL